MTYMHNERRDAPTPVYFAKEPVQQWHEVCSVSK